ncbi:cysteine hydrolase family protein [Nocardia stercoris]|uniref:Cysteine hydrolase n=1 Tax=Nocardia stercoris TaxID=2483361 RepID=A0A3M2L7S4_9NOCA|nr:isochorismatase family cysteine hydrolase [Nocardia stercoris]RMI32770.1 cysteine hydrolase [Nocardia stercoris]
MQYDPRTTALVVVDPYNEFLAEGGAAWPKLREVVERVGAREHLEQLVGAARAAGITVVYAPHRRWRDGDGDGWTRASRPHGAVVQAHLFAEGSFGGQWYPPLAPTAGDVVAYEHWGMGGFANTDLDLQLRMRGVERIVLAGMTAPGCVESTARQALELGYLITLVTDATAAYTDEMMHAAHEVTGPLFAEYIVDTETVLAAMGTTAEEEVAALAR